MEDEILARLRLSLLAILPITTFFNLAYFVLGAVATGVVDYIWFEDGVWYTRSDDENAAGHGAQLFFFYCTIPLLLTILTAYETLRLFLPSTKTALSETSPRMTVSASCGLGLWILQLGLTGTCSWELAQDYDLGNSTRAWCPFALRHADIGNLTWVVPYIAVATICS
ncbi:hypothetical protein D0864_04065 [Hortaea werneckii]|uniref:Uncharacterized protein n=1 Tax=Hortaea werneckii TaxID=91943 RepID=A0A3M7GDW9_HORWE|nr:hypothetical protein D0864_04065 [Hortaea werneckii]